MQSEALFLQQHLKRLPDYEGLKRLWNIIPEIRLVGGCVRDLLCGAIIHDVDLASPLEPLHVQQVLENNGIKVVPTGLAHGTVTAIFHHHSYEITTLRRDVETDGRHAVVEWTDNWREDAARRDFTINAMSLDRRGKIYDFFGGQDDLLAGRVRFVGCAAQRIEEDALRALRFFRFQARYGRGVADIEACEAVHKKRHLLKHLSVERIASEFLKILAGPAVGDSIKLMEKTGLLMTLFPSAKLDALERLLTCEGPAHALMRLYALCSNLSIGEKLKLSNTEKAALKAFASSTPYVRRDMDDDDLRRVRAVQALPLLLDRTWLIQAQKYGHPDEGWNKLRRRLEALSQPVFPLSGHDGVALGIAPGPELGIWLKKVRTWWMEQGCRPDYGMCMSWLKEQLSLAP